MTDPTEGPHRPAGADAERGAAIPPERLGALDAYWRAANYLGAAQLHLRENTLLREPLRREHLKRRVLGHWGTQPGLNLIYAHLDRLVSDTERSVLLVVGPGHGAPAVLANLFLEGTLGDTDEAYAPGAEGLRNLVRDFSWPYGLPSHTRPFTPGQIQEGGELGYSLAHAFGAAFDNPELLVACVIGDGEAETGPLAASWNGVHFLNPARDGAVLPIVHLNGYKIGNPTVLARTPDADLRARFEGLGYQPLIVAGDEPEAVHRALWRALDEAADAIDAIQRRARRDGEVRGARWPVLLLRTPKGWTGPERLGGEPIEGTFRSHGTPLSNPRDDDDEFEALDAWLRGYRPEELFGADGTPAAAVRSVLPPPRLRIGRNPHANGGERLVPLELPDPAAYAVDVARDDASGRAPRGASASSMEALGRWLRDVFASNEAERNFRLVCPDEITSNKLGAVFEATARVTTLPLREGDAHLAPDGRVMEVLSEHLCQGWLEGYLVTGRHGVFACYEAFVTIVDSMTNQFAKWLQASRETEWRAPIAPLTYVLTSHSWRQDHNGYSHQGPSFIDNLLTKKAEVVRIYLPPDANTTLVTLDDALRERDVINLVVASKQIMPQWFGAEEAAEHLARGAAVLPFASHDGSRGPLGEGGDPDLVLACAGDVPTLETIAAADLLREALPDVRVRVVNACKLLALDLDHPHSLPEGEFDAIFTRDRDVLFAFHGYPRVVHQLVHDRPNPARFHARGYVEEGSTTTPFDMRVRNGLSRFQLALSALELLPDETRATSRAEAARETWRGALERHERHVREHGSDLPEVTDWRWTPA